jgi:hypothetical protein
VSANPQQAESSSSTIPAAMEQEASVTDELAQDLTWQWNFLTSIFAMLWFFTLLGWLIYAFYHHQAANSTQFNSTAQDHSATGSEVKFNARRFKTACQQHDAQLVTTYLLRWGSQTFGQELQQLSQLLALLPNGEFKRQLELLAYQHYQREQSEWQGDALFTAWSALTPTTSAPTPVLKPLYPV